MKKLVGLLIFVSLLMIFSSCTIQSSKMRLVPPGVLYAPDADHALIVFMRPSRFGGAIQSSLFDVTTEENVLIGIVSAKTKIAYKVEPGEHLFMVIGESADFMRATLDAGKTYYSLVTPRMGVWKARFSFNPIHKNELGSSDLADWLGSCNFVEVADEARAWAREDAIDINNKRQKVYPSWAELSEEDKATLNREDGEEKK